MSIFEGLTQETMETLTEYSEMECEDLQQFIKEGITPGVIIGAINEYKAMRHTLNKLQYKYEKQKHDYNTNMLKKQLSEEYITKYKSLKQREQQATIEYAQQKEELDKLQYEIDTLKANKDGLELEIKAYYKLLDTTQNEHECQCKGSEE